MIQFFVRVGLWCLAMTGCIALIETAVNVEGQQGYVDPEVAIMIAWKLRLPLLTGTS